MRNKRHDPVELTLEEMLADPIVWTVMKSDGVNARELRELLAQVAAELALGGKEVAAADRITGQSGAYRPGVGIMLLNDRHEVLVGQRIDAKSEAWQMPQGGIDDNEDPREAAFRELREEIGTDKAQVIAETKSWLRYELPPGLRQRWNDRFCGQQQKWFVMRFLGEDSDINLATHQPEFAAWKWVSVESLPALIVSFKRQLYLDLIGELEASGAIRKQRRPEAESDSRSAAHSRAKLAEPRTAQFLENSGCGVAESKLAQAARYVTEGRQVVAEQRARVARLRSERQNIADAERALAQFERSLALFEADLKRLQSRED